ncbi:hypothetical protein ACF06X_22545 [Streptomyces sp. NPDC015346]|uniref:hypothetical protein n=1 Tax=Streptomyces sp. NPDC015346 TaxID=3364954 RepID=UPI0036FD6855
MSGFSPRAAAPTHATDDTRPPSAGAHERPAHERAGHERAGHEHVGHGDTAHEHAAHGQEDEGADVTASPEPAWWRRPFAEQLRTAANGAVLLVVAALVFVIVRLPWAGDLGVHAATIERLRHDMLDPGNPMVQADTDSPYYSPWMVFLGLVAKATDLNTFNVLRVGAVIGLALLITGIWSLTRTLTRHRAAAPLAVLCVFFLWGVDIVAWSGYLGFTSLALIIAYPSTFTLALGFHFLTLLTKALRGGTATGWTAYLSLGLLWAVLMLSHQFSGVVITLGAIGVLASARPWPAKGTWFKLLGAVAVGLAVLALWPYYSFFSLFGIGGLEEIHQNLYRGLLARYCLVLIGVVALVLRFVRNRRDPLVIWFALGLTLVVAGALTEKWSWGRAEPAVVIPAQIAAAIAAVECGKKWLRAVFATAVSIGLVAGAWAQRDALGFIMREEALPSFATKGGLLELPKTYEWTKKYAKYGDVFMSDPFAAQKLPAYGYYTIAIGYPDFFLPDEAERRMDARRYFTNDTTREEKLAILHKYGADWIVQWPQQGGLPANDPALKKAGMSPDGRVLYKVVG